MGVKLNELRREDEFLLILFQIYQRKGRTNDETRF